MRKLITALCLLTLTAGIAGCAPATTMPQFVTEQAPKIETKPVTITSTPAPVVQADPPVAEPVTATTQTQCKVYQSEVIEADWVRGNPDAPITIIEYSDFQCPYCAQFTKVLEQLMQQYPDDVKVVFRHYPLTFHPYAAITAQAAEAAGAQGKFWEFHDILFQNQDSWSSLDEQGVQSYLTDTAASLGLDMNQYNSDMANQTLNAKIKSQTDFGTAEGVTGTPFVVVNGLQWQGVDLTNMQQLIETLKLQPRVFSECPPTLLDQSKSYTAVIQTRTGEVKIKLTNQASPIATNAFAYMSKLGWYKNQSFYKLIKDDTTNQLKFLLGGNQINQGWFTFTPDVSALKFDHKGMVGMINPSQFFIAMDAAPDLDGNYSVLGEVTQGLDLLEAMQTDGEPIQNIQIIEE
jgi:protein-disulfide isomerase/cyclophilin family peptidyl-prolyl cis-trans isomerase